MVMVTISYNIEKDIKGFERIISYNICYNLRLKVKLKEKSCIELI